MTKPLHFIKKFQFIAVLGFLFIFRHSFFAAIIPTFLAGYAWWYFESKIRSGTPPLSGPWAPLGSPREQALTILWPLWRFGFFLNFVIILFSFLTHNKNWFEVAAYSPWVIFTSLGFLSAGLHHLAGSLEKLKQWVGKFTYCWYLFIGFTPFIFAAILSSIVMPLVYVSAWGQKDRGQDRCRKVVKWTFRLVLKYLNFIGFIEIKKIESKTPPSPTIYIGNHISMFDIISILAHVDHCTTFVKSKYARVLILIPAIHFCGFIPVDPTDPISCKTGLALAKKALQQGQSFVGWPEGTRTQDGQLGLFSNGFFGLALETKTCITPVVFKSSQQVFNNRGVIVEHHKKILFSFEFLASVYPDFKDKKTPGDVVILREQVRNIIMPHCQNEKRSLVKTIELSDQDPYFNGHFPGLKIYPAMAQLDLIKNEISRSVGENIVINKLQRAKFMAILKPGSIATLNLAFDQNSFQWSLSHQDTIFSKGLGFFSRSHQGK